MILCIKKKLRDPKLQKSGTYKRLKKFEYKGRKFTFRNSEIKEKNYQKSKENLIVRLITEQPEKPANFDIS